MRLIDADALKQKFYQVRMENGLLGLNDVYDAIDEAPTIEVNQGGDLISRQDAIDAICGNCSMAKASGRCIDDFCPDVRRLQEVSSAELPIKEKCCVCPYCDNCDVNEDGTIELKKGEWIDDVAFYDDDGCPCIVSRCNQCGEPNPISNYCPNCGADMRGNEDGM